VKPYIQMFSIHGLIRSQNLELGRDADTGGQVKYVVELGQHLSRRDDIGQVDLFTRLIDDKRVSSDYATQIETVNEKFRIIRIQCGGRKYIRKELLWAHLDEYVDKTIKFIKFNHRMPDIVHGHYPDGGYVAMQLSHFFGMPFIFTGHSLGRDKLRKLLDDGMKHGDIQKKYKIDHRIAIEENILAHADLVITSTHQERDQQYRFYKHHELPAYQVIPPGIDIEKFYPAYYNKLSDVSHSEMALFAQASMQQELNRFFMQPDKPLILALCRPDKRKNISGLVKAYGEDLEMQAMANLAIFAGIRKDIDMMEDNERDVLTRMLLMMDKYDLYGKLAIPKKHDFEHEVPALYRIAAESRGVFINPALTEPFGLTLLEASATGLPIVATNDGGPNDIIQNCHNGALIDATDTKAIAKELKTIIATPQLWEEYSKNGILNVRKHYTWDSHAAAYCKVACKLTAGSDADQMKPAVATDAIGRRLIKLRSFIFTDIDHTLIGEDNSQLAALMKLLERHRPCIGFGVATGRSIESLQSILKKYGVPKPDITISSVGAELYYGNHAQAGKGWTAHIGQRWQRDKIKDQLRDLDFLEYQTEPGSQRPFKISYYMEPGKDRLAIIYNQLLQSKCRFNLIYSHDKYLDILPYRASKGKAIRYISYKWGIPLRHILVCGDSGNDEEMLRGEPLAVVVGNHSHELDKLKGGRNIFFAGDVCAGGILEGLRHYDFITKAEVHCSEHSK